MYYALVGLVIIAVIFRLLPLYYWKFDGTDAWSHIFDAGQLRRFDGALPDKVKSFYPEPEFTYPWIISYFIYRFKPCDPVRSAIHINIILSLVEFLTAAFLLFLIINHGGDTKTIFYSSIAVIGVYAVSPIVYSPWAGVYGINARVLGALVTNVALVTMVFCISTKDYLLLIVPVLLIPIVIISSKFAVQAFILGAVALSLIYSSPIPLLVSCLGLVFSLLVTKGKVLSILKGHYKHAKFYCIFLQYHATATVYRTWSIYRWIINSIKSRTIKNSIGTLVWVPAIRVIIWNPWIILVLWGLLYVETFDEVTKGLLTLVFAGLVVIPVITTKGVRFLGEADRYFTFMSTMPLALLIGLNVTSLDNAWALYFLVFIYNVFMSVYMFKVRAGIAKGEGAESEQDVANYLEANCRDEYERVVVVPQNVSDKLACYCNCVFMGLHTNVTEDEEKWGVYFKLFPKFYPYPNTSYEELKSEYNVKHVVLAKRFVEAEYLRRLQLPQDIVKIPDSVPCFENEKYLIHKL